MRPCRASKKGNESSNEIKQRYIIDIIFIDNVMNIMMKELSKMDSTEMSKMMGGMNLGGLK